MINLELYRIFITVAKEQNLTKASKALNISQPAVSKHIHNLENDLQTILFKRSKYGMELTDDGLNLFDRINEAVQLLINEDNRAKNIRNINLGTHITMLSQLFSNSLLNYYNRNPKSNVSIVNENTDVMLSKLEKLELDIVFSKKVSSINLVKKDIKFISLGYLHDIFIIKNNSKYNGSILTKDDLKKHIIYTPRKTSITTINLLNTLGLNYNDNIDYIKNVKYPMILELIKNGDEIGIITKEYIQNELNKNEISILKTNFELPVIEFGVYINTKNKFKELNELLKIIRFDFNIK